MTPGLYTLDRFEGEWAVLETEQGKTFSVPREWLPADAAEGAALTVSASSEPGAKTLRVELDSAAQSERLSEARRLRDPLPRAPKGDISL
jgi:hypothetical protein